MTHFLLTACSPFSPALFLPLFLPHPLSDTCVNRKQLNCLNEGYVSPGKPENGYRCHCVCPPTHRGEHCEERVSNDYYESMNISLCGGQINRTDQIIEQAVNSTPCTWTINAPENQFIQIEFEHFALRQRFKSKLNNSRVNNRCLYESLGEYYLRANWSKCEQMRENGEHLRTTFPNWHPDGVGCYSLKADPANCIQWIVSSELYSLVFIGFHSYGDCSHESIFQRIPT